MKFINEACLVNANQNKKYLNNTRCSDDSEVKVFQAVYPFATEAVSEYSFRLDLKGKTLLTVGSSLDQAFNALVLGAKNIIVYDINANVEKFYKLKRDLILNTSRENLYNDVLNIDRVPFSPDIHGRNAVIRMNNYLQSDDNYELLRKRLVEDNISFVEGDIFHFNKFLNDDKFDRIIFSNILQYLDFFAGDKDPYGFLAASFGEWEEHLNAGGIIQLLYLYSFSKRDLKSNHHTVPSYNLASISSALNDACLELEWINSFGIDDSKDAVVTYTKRRR